MSAVDRVKVIVLHNDPVARAGIAATIGDCPCFEVLHSEDGIDIALHLGDGTRRAPNHVVVADYRGGFALAARIRRSPNPLTDPGIVIVTGNDGECEIRRALEIGVKGYVLVGCELQELLAGVHAVSRGLRHLCPQTAARLAESVSVEALSLREEEVLKLVVDGLCNKAISRRLGIAVGTVKSHLKSIFGKLTVGSRTQAMAVAQRRGLLRTVPLKESSGKRSQPRLSGALRATGLTERRTNDATTARASLAAQGQPTGA